MAPLVSVAVPTWNRAHLVGRAVRSALAQSFGDVEVIVVDDGSTDATGRVLAGLDDPRLRRIRHQCNAGISRTRNTAIGLARGAWIAFLDDDNEWAPDYLDRQLALAASRPVAGVVYCRARVRDDRSGAEAVYPETMWEGKVFRHLVDGWNPFVSGALLRRSEVAAIGGLDERLRATEDRDLWMRLAQRTDFSGQPSALLIRHERHGAQLSGDPERLARDAAILDAKWRADITARCGRAAHRRWHVRLLVHAERCRALRATEAGAGPRLEAARLAGRLLRLLPWSAPPVAAALAASILGPPRWRKASARLDWYRHRFRKGRGLAVSR